MPTIDKHGALHAANGQYTFKPDYGGMSYCLDSDWEPEPEIPTCDNCDDYLETHNVGGHLCDKCQEEEKGLEIIVLHNGNVPNISNSNSIDNVLCEKCNQHDETVKLRKEDVTLCTNCYRQMLFNTPSTPRAPRGDVYEESDRPKLNWSQFMLDPERDIEVKYDGPLGHSARHLLPPTPEYLRRMKRVASPEKWDRYFIDDEPFVANWLLERHGIQTLSVKEGTKEYAAPMPDGLAIVDDDTIEFKCLTTRDPMQKIAHGTSQSPRILVYYKGTLSSSEVQNVVKQAIEWYGADMDCLMFYVESEDVHVYWQK